MWDEEIFLFLFQSKRGNSFRGKKAEAHVNTTTVLPGERWSPESKSITLFELSWGTGSSWVLRSESGEIIIIMFSVSGRVLMIRKERERRKGEWWMWFEEWDGKSRSKIYLIFLTSLGTRVSHPSRAGCERGRGCNWRGGQGKDFHSQSQSPLHYIMYHVSSTQVRLGLNQITQHQRRRNESTPAQDPDSSS